MFVCSLQTLPFAYVLMTHRNRKIYDASLRHILDELKKHNPGASIDQIELVISDFEPAILGSMGSAFPNARPHGCWFHYGQAIFRKRQEFGLQQEYQKKGVIYLIVKQLIALALLPENEIFQGFSVYFEFLMNYYSICFNIVSIILIYIDTFLQVIKKKICRWTFQPTPSRPRCRQVTLCLLHELLASWSWTGNIQRLSWQQSNKQRHRMLEPFVQRARPSCSSWFLQVHE